MSNCPLVSVIIPNYNHAKYLDERIQSILNQTYQYFEVIILDDKSTDNSMEVINKYKKDPHISCVVVNEENSGSTFKQWHKGFELAKGDLIWIAESDDKCEKEQLETLVSFFVQEDRCVLAYTESVFFRDINGDLIKTHAYKEPELYTGIDFIVKRMVNGNAIANASSALFKKNVALTINKQYTEYQGAGDRLFWIEIAEQGFVGVDYHSLNYYRVHEYNSTKRNYKEGINQKEDFDILKYIFKKKYITRKQFNKSRIDYVRFRVLVGQLDCIYRKEVCKYWRITIFEKMYILYLNVVDILRYKLGVTRICE